MEDRKTLRVTWAKGLCKEGGCDVVGFFLTCRAPKIPSSLNKPVLDYNIKGKRARKKARKFESWLTSDHFLLHQLHELSFSCPLLFHANRIAKHTWACPFAAVDFFHRLFYRGIQFHPVGHIATRSMSHTKRLTNVEAIPFPTSKCFQSAAKFNSPASWNDAKSYWKVGYPAPESCRFRFRGLTVGFGGKWCWFGKEIN